MYIPPFPLLRHESLVHVRFTNARLDINCYKTFENKIIRRDVRPNIGVAIFCTLPFRDDSSGGKAFAPRSSSVGSFEAKGEIRGHLSEENSDYATTVGGKVGRGLVRRSGRSVASEGGR